MRIVLAVGITAGLALSSGTGWTSSTAPDAGAGKTNWKGVLKTQ